MPNTGSAAIRLVALFEGLKGAVVLLAATGLLALVHRDVNALAALLVEHAHLNPASRYPKIFLDAASAMTDARLWRLAAGAAAYAVLRGVEAYGLYRERTWAEVLAALSGAIYLPFEIAGLLRHPEWLTAALLLANLAVVALMLVTLIRRRQVRRPTAH